MGFDFRIRSSLRWSRIGKIGTDRMVTEQGCTTLFRVQSSCWRQESIRSVKYTHVWLVFKIFIANSVVFTNKDSMHCCKSWLNICTCITSKKQTLRHTTYIVSVRHAKLVQLRDEKKTLSLWNCLNITLFFNTQLNFKSYKKYFIPTFLRAQYTWHTGSISCFQTFIFPCANVLSTLFLPTLLP
jgi:hypothetical protein